MRKLLLWLKGLFIRVTGTATLPFVGIATVSARMPVYRRAGAKGRPVAWLESGEYAPHFTATPDHGWLNVTLRSGEKGWLQNAPSLVSITPPDPGVVTVCVDPGHGGSDSGATGNGLIEKHLNLDIAVGRLGPRLLADGRIGRVWFTRTSDLSVSLAYRTDLGNAAGSWLFLAVHNNAYLSDSQGTETYYKCGSESDAQTRAGSQRAACLTHNRIQEQLLLRCARASCPWVDRGVISRLISRSDRRSYYYVLRNSHGPAILLEYLFVSNPNEALCLADPALRDCLAQATYEGITDFLFKSPAEAPGNDCQFIEFFGL